MTLQRTRLTVLLSTAALILLMPLLAMQFTDQVKWDAADFIVAGVLLFGSVLVYELLVRLARSTASRVAVGIAVVAILALVWVELAVGVFGTPWAGS